MPRPITSGLAQTALFDFICTASVRELWKVDHANDIYMVLCVSVYFFWLLACVSVVAWVTLMLGILKKVVFLHVAAFMSLSEPL